MSRTIKEIYNEAVKERDKRMELSEFASDSKLSVMNGGLSPPSYTVLRLY